MPKVKVNDIQIYYEVRGRGFPLMMIIGLGANLDWWDPRMLQGAVQEIQADYVR